MNILWESPWPDWFSSFMCDRFIQEAACAEKIIACTNAIVEKMIVYQTESKISNNLKSRGIVSENGSFQVNALELLYSYYSSHPRLSVENFSEVLKTLIVTYKTLEDFAPASSAVYRKLISCLNSLTCHNNAQIRTAMKAWGLFEIRDNIVIGILESDMNNTQLLDFLESFSFEMVADQPKFRDSNGLFFLLRLFHRSFPDLHLQKLIVFFGF